MRFLLTTTSKLLLVLLCCTVASAATPAQKKPPAKKPTAQAPKPKPKAVASKPKPEATATTPAEAEPEPVEDEEALKAELDAIKDLAVAERVTRLEAFVAAHPNSTSRPRALELLTGARAALGDEKLRTGDRRGGVELFRQVVADVTAETSDRLFVEIVSKLPANLYLLNEREAGAELAREVERKAAGSARRLLSVASFYLGFELADDAVRVGEEAVRLAPDMAAAHQALGAAYRMALRLDEAAREYARALELEPNSAPTRRSLADLLRATGKAEDALALYRAHVASEPADAGARAGLVLSLFDAGRKDEAEAELQKALADQPENLQLLVGAAFHFAAEGQGTRALELARQAVGLEPRAQWVWARLAVARALLAEKRPLDAERAVRLARDLGRFPTLDYELAAALAAAGLYDEAAEELARSFAIKDGQIETYLAGRTSARNADFLELLAPERRASTFQNKAADTSENARILKALLAFHLATGSGAGGPVDEKAVAEAAREFATGDDGMRTFRELYVAGKLLERGAALSTVVERTDEAMTGVDAAVNAPSASTALLADELRDARLQARAMNASVNVPVVLARPALENFAGAH